jgi:uncharacterized protein (TIGR03437 family)
MNPNYGPIPITVSYAVASPTGGHWLAISHGGASVPSGSSFADLVGLVVQPDLTGLVPGRYSASVTIAPSGGGALTIPVTLTVRASSKPAIAAVVNAASFATGGIAPGEIITISGTGLGPPLGLTLDFSGKVASTLGGVTVSFNDYPAPLLYVGATQINCVVPYELDGASDVQAQVALLGQTGVIALKGATAAPALFTLDGTGTGTVAAANSTGGYNGPANPAAVGSTITFYLTGEGQTNPQGITGKVTTVNTAPGAPLTPQPLITPTVTIGGIPAKVLFYGEAPDMVSGVLQLNVQIPAGLSAGSLPLTVHIGSTATQNGVTVAVK